MLATVLAMGNIKTNDEKHLADLTASLLRLKEVIAADTSFQFNTDFSIGEEIDVNFVTSSLESPGITVEVISKIPLIVKVNRNA